MAKADICPVYQPNNPCIKPEKFAKAIHKNIRLYMNVYKIVICIHMFSCILSIYIMAYVTHLERVE